MSLWRLIIRSAGFYWRTNLTVLLAVAVATGVLTGALAVGDSVRYTLEETLEARLGKVGFAILPQGRYFRAVLADDLERQLGGTVVPVLQVSGIITNEDGSRRVNRVQVLGVTDKFYAVGSGRRPDTVAWESRPWVQGSRQEARATDGAQGVILSETVAQRLGVAVGGEVVLRVEKPGLMPRDVPLASDKDRTAAFRLKVGALADDSTFGRFDLQANQTAPLNVFVPLSWLGGQIEQPERANMLLAAHLRSGSTADDLSLAVEKVWRPADAGLEIGRLPRQNLLELRSRRIFIDDAVSAEAVRAGAPGGDAGVSALGSAGSSSAHGEQGQDASATNRQPREARAAQEPGPGIPGPEGQEAASARPGQAVGVLTYFVNEIRRGDKATPYSTVTATDDRRVVPADMRDDEIVITQWLADDLGAKLGDPVDITYYILGARRQLLEQKSQFKVVRIVPMGDPVCDPNLMPAIPGLADVENCRDWKPGIPVDLDRIRPKDEQYWNEHRGTPKAFITLKAGQTRWRNQYGNLTAVRYSWREGLTQELEQNLTRKIDPATVGLYFQPVRDRGVEASRQGTDFGELFLGLSMFLIAAAVILVGLLFVFGVESRGEQVGLLLAVGWPARRVRKLLLAEGGLVALLGTAAGVGLGLLYTQVMVYGLGTLWSGAVGGARLYFHVRDWTLLWGGLGGLVAALFAIWTTLRKQATRPARQLLAGSWEQEMHRHGRLVRGGAGPHSSERPRGRTAGGRFNIIVAVVAFLSVAVFLLVMPIDGGEAAAGAFFGAGALLLVGTLALIRAALRIAAGGWDRPMVSLQGLGLRNATRRSGRSLAIVALLACGVFMVAAVGANRRNPRDEAKGRDSGTGGFALYGDSSIPILHDLNTASGREALGLADQDLKDVQAVQFRVRAGDDASCLNLNRAQQPRLMAVQTDALVQLNAFKFTAAIDLGQEEKGWGLLRMDLEQGAVPAVGDYPTVFWGLGKNIGDELEYTDEMGRPFRVRIVGMLADSVLQGSLVIAENEFVARFPSVDGYRVFLLDAPPQKAETVAQTLSGGLRDYGLVLTPTQERLAAFGAVENTYLSIFTALGGLGLVLGSVGLGLVVLRNMLERRGELAMLRAVGFGRSRLRRMVFYEHWGLMLAGLACGVVSAVVAVLPVVHAPGGEVPYRTLFVTVAAIALSGAVWVWLAGTLALRGRLLDALRHE